MPVKPTAMHLIQINKPRKTFLMGPKELLAKAQQMAELKRGNFGYFTFQGVGEMKTHEIEVAGGLVYEIDAASAARIIETFGLEIGEEGLPLEAIEGA